MCGILGVFSSLGEISEVDSDWVKVSIPLLSHRGPNASGFYSDNHVCFGHTRLSIIDTSEASNQPFLGNSKDSALIFNGEIYNFQELAKEFSLSLKSKGDTEVLSLLCQSNNLNWLEKLRGMFVFAYSDHDKFILTRDPVGIKPLYYVEIEDRLYFSSELRPLLQIKKNVRESGICELFQYQATLEADTFIEGIKRLEPGERFVYEYKTESWRNNLIGILGQKYPTKEIQQGEAHACIKSAFKKAVSRRLISDVPIGVFLSGGIDSSAIALQVAELGAKNVETFTLGFEDASHNEADIAGRLSKELGLKNTQVFLSDEQIISHVDEAISAMDFPSGDALNTFIVSRYAKEAGLTVCLSGLGGDELFMGYPSVKRLKNVARFRFLRKYQIPKFIKSKLIKSIDGQKLIDLLDSEMDDQEVIRNSRILIPESLMQYPNLYFEDRIVKAKNREQVVTLSEFQYYTIPLLLNDADQMGMANALEIRVPFLDVDFIETVMTLPENLRKFDHSNISKKLFVEAMGGDFPKYIYSKKKQGFALPMARWMRGPLREYVKESLDFKYHEKWLKIDQIDAIISSFFNEENDKNWSRVWMIAVVNRWMKINGVDN